MPDGFTGTLSRKISVLITKALDISQPLAKNEAKANDEDSEDEGGSDDEFGGESNKLVSAYLNSGLDTE